MKEILPLKFRYDWHHCPAHPEEQVWGVSLPRGLEACVFLFTPSNTWSFRIISPEQNEVLAGAGLESRLAAQEAAEMAAGAILAEQFQSASTIMAEFLPFLLPDLEEIIQPNRGRVGAGYAIVPLDPTPEALGAWWRIKNGHHFSDEPDPEDRTDAAAYRALVRHARVAHIGEADTPAEPIMDDCQSSV